MMKATNAIVTEKTLDLIKKFEGFRSSIYKCPAGKDTIGYGHVVQKKEIDFFKNKISEKQATILLKKDCEIALSCVTKLIKIDLNENQIGALVSLVLNVGCAKFKKSKGLALLNENKIEEAKKEFFDEKIGFVKANKVILEGLVLRRAAEKNLFCNKNV